MRRLLLAAAVLLGLAPQTQAQTAQTLPLSQNWTDAALITANDIWSGVPGIVGYRGDNLTAATGADPQTILAEGSGTPLNVIANQTAPNTLSSGGIAEFEITNPVVAFQGSGTADVPHLVVRIVTTGRQNIRVRYLLRDIDGSADNAVQPVALHYRVGTTGNYTNVAAAFVADASTGPSVATLETPVDVTLPADANNQAVVELRILTTNAVGNDEWIGVDDIQITGEEGGGPPPAETASVAFNPALETIAEGESAALTIAYALANPDANPANNPAVSGAVEITSANPDQIVSFTGTFSFPAGTLPGATTTVAVTSVNDAVFTGTRQVSFGFGTVTGGTAAGMFTLTINDDETPPPPPANFVINEIDAAMMSNSAEFVELLGPPNTSVEDLVLVFYNGSNNLSYRAIDLTGTTDANGLYLVGNPGVTPAPTITFPVNTLQNGEDGLALYVGAAASFPTGTAPTQTNLVDALVYGTNDPNATGLLTGLGEAAQFNENDTQSLARLNTAAGPSGLFYTVAPSPGAANPGTLTVAAQGLDAGAGWRQLGVPAVRPTGQPFDVGTLAGLNLVQGIPAGTTNPAQYPTAVSNVLTGSTLTPPASTDAVLAPGQGFFWALYDQAITPDPASFGGGTSQSFPISGFTLAVTGTPVDDRLNGGPYTQTLPNAANQAYLLANPFAYPVALAGLTASSGTLSTSFQVWNPTATGGATYEIVTGTLPVWQGAFAEVTGATGPVTFTISSDNVRPTGPNTVIGREAAEPRFALALAGTLADGTPVADRAALLHFPADAADGWDRHDASKAPAPAADLALVAFTGDRDGAAIQQAVRSLEPTFDAARALPLAFRATQAGTFTLTWERLGLPDGVQAELRDLATGTVTNLASASSYTFSADAAADWSARFELILGNSLVANEGAPTARRVSALFPNPATDRAALTVQVDAAQAVAVRAYDALGRQVAVLFEGALAAGAEQTLALPTATLAPGVYVVRVEGEGFAETRRLTVVR